MCDFSNKLICWLDGELPPDESKTLERHLDECGECRAAMRAYRDVSRAFVDCCDRIYAVKSQRRTMPLWPRLAAATAAVATAAAVVAMFFISRTPPKQPPVEPAVTKSVQTVASPRPVAAVHRARAVTRKHVRPAAPPASIPSIRIAIPADAVFPPGMFPEGVAILADLSFGADGTPSSLRLHP